MRRDIAQHRGHFRDDQRNGRPRQQHRQAILESLLKVIAGADADNCEKENQPNLPLKHVDDNQRDVVLLSQRGRLPKTYLKEQLIR